MTQLLSLVLLRKSCQAFSTGTACRRLWMDQHLERRIRGCVKLLLIAASWSCVRCAGREGPAGDTVCWIPGLKNITISQQRESPQLASGPGPVQHPGQRSWCAVAAAVASSTPLTPCLSSQSMRLRVWLNNNSLMGTTTLI